MNRRMMLGAVALCLLLSQPAVAQSDFGFKRGGLAISIVSPENVDATLGLGVFADMGTIAPRWGFESRLDWWSHTESVYSTEATMTDLTLGARTKYQFPVTSSSVQPFAGVGLGLHFLNAEVVVIDPSSGYAMTADASETRLGMDLGGGISTSLNSNTQLLAEGWFSLVSDFNQFSLRVGMSRAFGN
ncbi:MAG: outer membrane beta-barrel protein [Candidatus Eisenbacteria bacterium]